MTAAPATARTQKFGYRVRLTNGKMETGDVPHTSRKAVVESLSRNPDIETILYVSPTTTTGVSKKARAKTRSLVAAFRKLDLCLDNGLDERESIDYIRNGGDLEDSVLEWGLGEVSKDMGAGLSLPRAMEKHPYIFPPVTVQTLQAGQDGGFIKSAALQAADDMEAEDDLRAKVKKALTYPIVILAITSLIFIFLMMVVVPKFADMYKELSNGAVALPMMTQVVVGISNQMAWMVPVLAVASVIGTIYYRRNSQEENVRSFVDPLKLKAPVFGKLFHLIALTRFCRVMNALTANAVHPTDALLISSKAVGNILMERALVEASEASGKGDSIAESLARSPLFPPFLTGFVAIGEKTSNPAKAMGSVGRLYDRDVDDITNRMEALIQPLFLVAIAGMVGIVAIAIYLPYFSLGDVVSPY